MPWEWVRKTALFDGICAQLAVGTESKCSLASGSSNLPIFAETVRVLEIIGRDS